MAATKRVKAATPTHRGVSWPSIMASEIQSLAVPSASAKVRTITPMSRVRRSVQALRAVRRSGPSRCGATGRNLAAAHNVRARPSRATAPRWTAIGTPRAVAATPPAAPATLPRLQPAWNRGITVRRSRRSTSAPSTFIATSHTPVPTPYVNSPTAVPTTDPTVSSAHTPAPTSPMALSTAPPRTTAAAPHRSTKRPADGSASTDPAAIASNSRPREPLSRSRPSRTSGTRARRVAKRNPLRAKTRPTALRAVVSCTGPVNRLRRLIRTRLSPAAPACPGSGAAARTCCRSRRPRPAGLAGRR